MRDYDVRVALRRRLDIEHAGDDSTRVVEELGLCEEVRIDFAVINGSLTGFELKSERDTLVRLPRQAATYNRVFDYVYLVSAQRHVDHACEVIPTWWGILIAESGCGTDLSLRTHRRARRNPSVDPSAVVQLLWRDEALAILERLGADTGVRSKPREFVWGRLIESVSLTGLRREVRNVLKARRGWRESPELHESVATSPLSDTNSRFLARRIR
ncbi:Uncharacterised protein [Mycobacteroides abscessus]|uniref:sce7726 family protein n=1 Tax=Mycobacteroides abscessus TaxID=36809 RepID=UPI0005E9FEF0|nr:Uncharacterised protein [Mycobacteroides abscessus]SIC78260.1 Uncharacterised protein [Mycobacteroides abscessus subsp. abscessus]SKQ68127.1 Uncharacterised protein [Mycobacteroides abscessus subsp. massiliense]CPW55514.1 Uncharacterised protein [Mycobacteroides abscessus]CQA10851.1 Uncharacterised protein [Mycobacteroides abscessus]